NVGKPQVAYRETIRKPVHKVEGKFIRQSGGRGQYGHAVIDLEPTGPGGGYEFVNKITGGAIPREYIPAVDQGIQEASESGVMGDVTARRGRIERIDQRGAMRAIRVIVPLAELFGYATELRSRTQGRASHTPMQLHAYQEVPQGLAREIIARVRGE